MILCSCQIEQHERNVSQLQADLREERSRHQDTGSNLQQAKKTIANLHEETDALHRTNKDVNAKVRDHHR